MAEEYDAIEDLWYSWLFSRLHYLIATHVIGRWPRQVHKVADIGCGTGFQSFLYALAGSCVTGVDIAEKLVGVATEKANRFARRMDRPLFDSPFGFAERYEQRWRALVDRARGNLPVLTPRFDVADATALPFENESFHHVNCCGSTLSFIEDYGDALAEMSRILVPDGTFVLEVESKYNLDAIWALADVPLAGRLHFETTLKEAGAVIWSSPSEHALAVYPFGDPSNPVYMDLILFSKRRLRRELATYGLVAERCFSIHSVTNAIPSTFLDSAKPTPLLVALFRALASVEAALPIQLPGCSLVIVGRRSGPLSKSR